MTRTPPEDIARAIIILTNIASRGENLGAREELRAMPVQSLRMEISSLKKLKDDLNALRYRVIDRLNDAFDLLEAKERQS